MKKVFKESTQMYQKALKILNEENKRRKRKITWFNPPYSKKFSTKVGNQWLKLINQHFPRHHKFYKLFNKNNFKVSYNYMNIINTYNKEIINPPKENIGRTCKIVNQ